MFANAKTSDPLASASFSLVRHCWPITGPKPKWGGTGPGASRYGGNYKQCETTLSWLKAVRNRAFRSLTPTTSIHQLNTSVPSLRDCGSAAIAATDARGRILPGRQAEVPFSLLSKAPNSRFSRCHQGTVRIQAISSSSASFVAGCRRRHCGAESPGVGIGEANGGEMEIRCLRHDGQGRRSRESRGNGNRKC